MRKSNVLHRFDRHALYSSAKIGPAAHLPKTLQSADRRMTSPRS
jgi:hypothetical protein